jgi:hypothetical protein
VVCLPLAVLIGSFTKAASKEIADGNILRLTEKFIRSGVKARRRKPDTLSALYKRMRLESEKKFKDKIRELTVRKHNLDEGVIVKLNRVIRGT